MKLLARTGGWLTGLSGWRALLWAFAAGAVSALAFAPLEVFPALLLGYAVLVLLLDGAAGMQGRFRRAAGLGWAFFFGQFLIGLHWIVYPFLIYPDANLWELPFAVFLPAGLALFGALAAGLCMAWWPKGPARILAFTVAVAASEWLRGHVFTGFPWNLSGYGWGASLALLQSASLMGIYSLSFLTILFGASLAELVFSRWRLPVALLLLFAGLWGYGVYRVVSTPIGEVTGVRLRLVQPDIPQAEKYVRRLTARNWQRLFSLSIEQAGQQPAGFRDIPTHIIWPEAATGLIPVARSPEALNQIALLTARGQTLMTGSDRVLRDEKGITAYNSLYLFAPGKGPVSYDKFHLVPFGEYLPFAPLLNAIGISQLTVGLGFSAGDHPRVLDASPAPPVTPLICYEVIFPHAVIDPAEPRPGWLVNITDDSWFGPWAGPQQHFLIARVRAIEEGLPIARAANSGISAVIDPLGRVPAKLALNRMGVVDAALPQALPPPPYARIGDLVFLSFLVIAAFASAALNRR
ncbi:MAG TPA: apolipoprotein N-acyltransferase [Rhizomicrobium sp.]|nr:apolipoprotein N-acyltransferase [Rhizomicrobium sp.]